MFTRPLGTVSAPCLLAFVHNSLIVITKGSAAAGLIRIGVGWIRNCSRLGVSKGSIAVFNNSGSIAPAQLVRRSRSWTRPNAPNRAEIASPACGKSTAVRRLWLVIDCTIAKVFFTLWCNSSSMSRCSFSALSRLAASVVACSRSPRRLEFSSSSLKSPSLISANPRVRALIPPSRLGAIFPRAHGGAVGGRCSAGVNENSPLPDSDLP